MEHVSSKYLFLARAANKVFKIEKNKQRKSGMHLRGCCFVAFLFCRVLFWRVFFSLSTFLSPSCFVVCRFDMCCFVAVLVWRGDISSLVILSRAALSSFQNNFVNFLRFGDLRPPKLSRERTRQEQTERKKGVYFVSSIFPFDSSKSGELGIPVRAPVR